MKRIAAFLVALFIIATCTVYVSAAGVTAVMSSANAEIGDTVNLTVTLSGAAFPETKAMAFEIYLPEGFKLQRSGTKWAKEADIANININDNRGAWAYGEEWGEDIDPNGVILNLSIKIEEGAKCGENVINFDYFVDSEKTIEVAETAGIITIPHTWDDELTNTDAEGHYYACAGCDDKKDFEEHGFDMSCDETCDECGYTRTEVEHDFGEDLVNDDPEGHYYKCACGAKDGEAAHVYSYDCDATCNDCGYEREAADHQPVGDVKFDEDGHWGECACGEQIDKTAHEFEYECSTECTYCDYTREAEHDFSDMASWNEDEHWYDCMYECGAKDRVAPHVYDQEIAWDEYLDFEATCSDPTTYFKSCVCGYCDEDEAPTFTVGEPDENAHLYIYDHEDDTATCIYCGDIIGEEEGLKGADVEEITGDGATITAPEGVLGENMSVAKEDATEELKKQMEEDGIDLSELDESLEGYEIVEYSAYYIDINGVVATLTSEMELTVKIPTGKFTDIKPYTGNGDFLYDYVDNGDGTITITLDSEESFGMVAVPLLFVGKPIAKDTSDNGLTALWIAILAIAVVGVAATAFYSKKRRTTK